jgi:hypothetical protein
MLLAMVVLVSQRCSSINKTASDNNYYYGLKTVEAVNNDQKLLFHKKLNIRLF